jgi:hypothetical protein
MEVDAVGVIAVFVLCVATCLALPVLLARSSPPGRGTRRGTLEEIETGIVSALLAGDLRARDYRDGMASVASQAADYEPIESWLPAEFRCPID